VRHGIINIYKEKGYTSHDVVAKLRGILKQKKIGHTGTLDPDATGVLPVCLGKGTKLCDMLTDKDKTYETTLLLGKETDTQDITGTVLKERAVQVTQEEVEGVILSFIGEYAQIPPMYSALKVNGKKLYELARAGIEVERKPRNVWIHNIEILGIDLPRVQLRVSCSKGTYIRTLLHDIGQKLECGGCMEELLRTQVGSFSIENSYSLERVQEMVATDEIDNVVIAIDDMFPTYVKAHIKEEFAAIAYNGNPILPKHLDISADEEPIANEIRLYNEKQEFIGIYAYKSEEQYYKLLKMFFVS